MANFNRTVSDNLGLSDSPSTHLQYGAVNLTALANEINTDPNGYGYAALKTAGNDQAIADLLNAPRGSLPLIYIGLVSPVLVLRCIVRADFLALSAGDQNLILGIIQAGQIDASDANTRNTFGGAFAGKQTLNNLLALVQRTQSRGEQLFGLGTVITAINVANSLGRF